MDHNEDLPDQGEEECSVAVKRLFTQLTYALETLAPGLFTSPAQLFTLGPLQCKKKSALDLPDFHHLDIFQMRR